MKVLRALVLLALLSAQLAVFASGPDDDYVGIYNLIQRGDALNERGDPQSALGKYTEAQNALIHFQTSYPDWNLKIVNYRLRYLANQITELSNRLKNSAAPASPAITNTPPVPSAPSVSIPTVNTPMVVAAPVTNLITLVAPRPPPMSEAEIQVKRLQDQIQGLEADNATLQAKLKEAFAAQPTSVSPQEFSKAQARVLDLQKQNDLLAASLAETKATSPAASGTVIEKLKQALSEANEKVKQLSASNATLQSDNQAMQTQLAALRAAPDAAVLATENAVLKKELADLKARNATPATPTGDDSAAKLQEGQAKLAVLQSEKEVLQQQKATLENRVKELSAAPALAIVTNSPAPQSTTTNVAPAMDSNSAARIAELEAARDELQKSLDAATKDAGGSKKAREMAARIDELMREVAGLQAHIMVLESSNVPYTADELALLNKPANVLVGASAHHAKKEHRAFSPAQASLVKEGQQFFVEKKYDQAEQKYEAVLAMDPTNVVTLADLASVQLEAGHLAEAEQNLKDALAIDPDDDYSLYVLGQVKFQEKDYDASLNALSRASEITPLNANIRNFIGLALDEKGLRREAETAFRRAIQLDPEFAEAHMNLAVVYATQKPPLIQLAKWHYQKAMTIGHTPNRALEKILDDVAATTSAGSH